MRLDRLLIGLFIMLSFAVSNTSCKKDKLLTSGGELRYSLDTLTFDTVFTAYGSFTAQVKLYNPQNQKVNISSVKLGGPDASFFHINVNGYTGNATNLELAAHDSMYIFATVNVDPNNQNNPFVVNAMITATMNGKDYNLPLMAFGLNAHYIVDSVLDENRTAITWQNDLPYVIIHSALVPKGQTLTIEKGCRVYMNGDSRLFVQGTLKTNGTKQDSVIFQGDRLDRKYFGYEGYPGEWGGLYFFKYSSKNELNYTTIRNGGNTAYGAQPAAIQVDFDTIDDQLPTLTLNNCIIENSIGHGILGFGATVVARNCLITQCGAQALAGFQGGGYYFDNCDFITYGNSKLSHIDNAMVGLQNYLDIDDINYLPGSLYATLRNCVIWGSIDNECLVRKKGNGDCNVQFINCAIKHADPIDNATLTNLVNTSDPKFVDYQNGNFRLQDGSPLIDAGTDSTTATNDLDDKPRTGKPDVGCYEH